MGLFDFLKSKNKNVEAIQPPTVENVVEDIVVEEPIIEEPIIEEPIIEEPIVEEPVIEEPIVEESVTEEPIVEEPIVEPAIDEFVVEVPQKEKKGLFARLKEGLNKTRNSILGSVDGMLSAFTKIDEDLFEELEEILIMADMGVETTMNIIDNLRKRVKKEGITDPSRIKGMLVDEISNILLEGADEEYDVETPTVLLVIGVNGVGKTTTIGKLSNNLKAEGKTVLLGAADTFRAAAIDQLEVWGERSGIEVIKHEENSDPAAVVFDAVNAAKNRKTDVLICDTAGRLHNKKNLMEELKKISKVIEREYPSAHKETYLVLDATTGQNAMQQAKLFKEVADITGIVLTKLDGTAKGGIVVAIKSELKIPVRYIGVGESIEDLQKFDARSFAKALFGEE
ncbi:MAG TPA: signal recognition particle-docking protein FtsY [Lachnospiraceae bacterium]|nr:signal recognition particle-docking protein FtsY [Lachnospiraceae bacterium]